MFDAARARGVQLASRARWPGVVPAIRVMAESLAAPHRAGPRIVNGTTNFILTQMAAHGRTYDEALREAQEMGYAEADPTEDVTGKDAAAKMAILARLAFNVAVRLDQVSYEGIERLTPDDISLRQGARPGAQAGRIGRAHRRRRGRARLPAFLYAEHPLAWVNGAFNAVTIESPAITEITLSAPARAASRRPARCSATWSRR